jgi:hypothetical protein
MVKRFEGNICVHCSRALPELRVRLLDDLYFHVHWVGDFLFLDFVCIIVGVPLPFVVNREVFEVVPRGGAPARRGA